MASADGSLSILHSSDQTDLDVHCDPCKYTDIHKEATHYCTECQENLCKACAESHKRLKLLRNHTLVPISHSDASKQPPSNPVLCECDQKVTVTDFCDTHKEVICESCRTIKHRKCNTCSTYTKRATEETLKETIKNAEKQKREIEKSITMRNEDLDYLSVVKASCRGNVETYAEQLKLFIDSLKLETLKDIDKCEDEQRRKIEQQIISLSTVKKVIEKDETVVQLAMRSGNESVMFAADIKISKHLEDYQTLLHDIAEDIICPKLEFETNKQVIAFQEKETTLGTVNTSSKRKLFPGLTVQSCSEIDIKLPGDDSDPYITGCIIMPDGDILICDRNNKKVKHFSKVFNFLGSLQLQGRTWDASMVDETTIIVCMTDNKQLQYIDIKPKLQKGRALNLDIYCYGVDVVGNEIFISGAHDHGIRVYDKQGQMKRKIKFGLHVMNFGYLKVKPNLNTCNIYITDNVRNMLICLKTDGSAVFEYSDNDLKYPRGLCVDNEGNSIVCGFNSSNVHVVNAMGEKVHTLRSANDGLKKPQCLSFIEESGTLFIGCSSSKQLLALKLV